MNSKYGSFCLFIVIEILMLFGVFVSNIPVASADIDLDTSCIDPFTACANAEILDKVYDPEDCHQYYDCITDTSNNIVPSDNPLQCDNNQYFDYSQQSCVNETYTCQKACINKQCVSTCPAEGSGVVADEYNCGIFYNCFNGLKSASIDCPAATPYFNGNECTENAYSCCVFCLPYCNIAGIETEDPYDCYSYYLCEEQGDVSEDRYFQCPEGEFFDTTQGVCATYTLPCQNTCTQPE